MISYDSEILLLTPSLFDSGAAMVQNEYRKVEKNSEFIIDFGFVNKKSSIENNKNSIFNLFKI